MGFMKLRDEHLLSAESRDKTSAKGNLNDSANHFVLVLVKTLHIAIIGKAVCQKT